MFRFTLSSETFNPLLKRLVSMSGGDKSAIISFALDNGKLDIYYHSKLDKTDSSSLFHETLPLVGADGKGQASLYLHNLFAIKIPEFISEDRFPHCRTITFDFGKQILEIKFGIRWNKTLPENITKLHFPLLDKEEDLEKFDKLFSDKSSNNVVLDSGVLNQSIGLCNFIKTDVTSKDSNGCFLQVFGSRFGIVNTDSNTAVRFVGEVVSRSVKKDFGIVLAGAVLNAIKNFINEEGQVTFSASKSNLVVSSEGRTMLVPVMQSDYIISDPESFFSSDGSDNLGILDLKPVITLSSALTNKSNDLNKRLNMRFEESGLNLSTEVDSTDNVPSTVEKIGSLSINGTYFLTACQRLLNVGLMAKIKYDPASCKVTMISSDEKLTFLIQGLAY